MSHNTRSFDLLHGFIPFLDFDPGEEESNLVVLMINFVVYLSVNPRRNDSRLLSEGRGSVGFFLFLF